MFIGAVGSEKAGSGGPSFWRKTVHCGFRRDKQTRRLKTGWGLVGDKQGCWRQTNKTCWE